MAQMLLGWASASIRPVATHANIFLGCQGVVTIQQLMAKFCKYPGIGFHFLQIVEAQADNQSTFWGDGNFPTYIVGGGVGSIEN